MSEKILAALSGGVDSSVSAALLLEQGHELAAVTLKLFNDTDLFATAGQRTCCSLSDVEEARRTAYRLGIEHFVYNFSYNFEQEVICRFCNAYAAGQTPNPCIDCNRYIKFPLLLRRALSLGYSHIATGHYARCEHDTASGRYLLKKGLDAAKDQSYVLYALTQEELAHTLFPLGYLSKSQTRQLAEKYGLSCAHKAESQDICFVPDGDYAGFLRRRLPDQFPPGDILDREGRRIGRHRGLIHYTIGQRKGLQLQTTQPHYVLHKDAATNTLTVGPDPQGVCGGCYVTDLNWIALAELTEPLRCSVKTRYRQRETAATLRPIAPDCLAVHFETPQPPVAPGQAAVFYDGDLVLGGGTILHALHDAHHHQTASA